MARPATRPNELTLEQALGGFTVDQLRGLAFRLGWPEPRKKAELIAIILQQVEGDRLRAVVERLGKLERRVVAEVVHGSTPVFRRQAFKAKYGEIPAWQDFPRRPDWKNLSLLHLFLQGSPPRMVEELRKRLRPIVSEPPSFELQAVDEAPGHLERARKGDDPKAGPRKVAVEVCETEAAAHHDLRAVLSLVDEGKIAVSPTSRWPTPSSLDAVGSVLLGGDFYANDRRVQRSVGPVKAFAWPLIVQAARFAELAGSKLRLTRKGREAIVLDPAVAIRTAFEDWADSTLLDELRRIESIRGQTGRGKRRLSPLPERRDVLANALAECPVGRWVAVDEFFRMMRACNHDFEVTREPWTLYFAEHQYGSLGYEGYGGWEILQARYALAFLFEYVATLGLVDVAYVPPEEARPDYKHMWGADDLPFLSRYDGLAFFRLTNLGAFCLGMESEYSGLSCDRTPTLTVLPTLEVVDGGGSNPVDRMILDGIARRESEHVSRLDSERLLSYLEKGHPLSEVLEFLDSKSDKPLPETVRVFLEDVGRRADSLRDSGSAWLIECAEPELAARIANEPRMRGLCLLAGKHHLAIPDNAKARFRTALRKLGYAVPRGSRIREGRDAMEESS